MQALFLRSAFIEDTFGGVKPSPWCVLRVLSSMQLRHCFYPSFTSLFSDPWLIFNLSVCLNWDIVRVLPGPWSNSRPGGPRPAVTDLEIVHVLPSPWSLCRASSSWRGSRLAGRRSPDGSAWRLCLDNPSLGTGSLPSPHPNSHTWRTICILYNVTCHMSARFCCWWILWHDCVDKTVVENRFLFIFVFVPPPPLF